MSSAPTLDAYNAKWLKPDEVARSFVAPASFVKVAKRRNSLLVGPRGSGKTTLLKMLTESALEQWSGRRAGKLKTKIDYVGVFIATDVSWNSQVSSLGGDGLPKDTQRSFQMAALTAHTHLALLDAMELRANRLSASQPKVSEFASELAGQWHLNPRVPSFYSLRAALRRRLQSVYEIATVERGYSADGRAERLSVHKFLSMPLVVSCRSAVELFNESFHDTGRYWALLFDELELMPRALREELYTCLRSLPGPIIFKLAFSPFDEQMPSLSGPDAPQRDQDYDFIALWYTKKHRAHRFCRELWRVLVKGTSVEGLDPEQVLGNTLVDTDVNEWLIRGTAYTQGSPHHAYLCQLEQDDVSFRSYLEANQLNLNMIESIRGSERASTLRKIFPLVVARVEYRRFMTGMDDVTSLRSRKSTGLYTGATALFDVSEGNPRTFVNLVGRLLDRLDGRRSIQPSDQAQEILQASNRFRAMLRTIVIPEVSSSQFPRSMLSLIDPIGKRLQELSLRAPFSSEPPGSFIVDSKCSEEVLRILGAALNAGAIIYVPDQDGSEDVLSTSRLRGKRFRLSYLLVVPLGIVPRLARAISLGELLKANRGDHEVSLFDDGRDGNGLTDRGT